MSELTFNQVDIETAAPYAAEDADTPPGPLVPAGDPVNWTYLVTNVGNIPLDDWSVTDNRVGPVSCPRIVLAALAALSHSSRVRPRGFSHSM